MQCEILSLITHYKTSEKLTRAKLRKWDFTSFLTNRQLSSKEMEVAAEKKYYESILKQIYESIRTKINKIPSIPTNWLASKSVRKNKNKLSKLVESKEVIGIKRFPVVLSVGYMLAENGLYRLLRLFMFTTCTSMCYVPKT